MSSPSSLFRTKLVLYFDFTASHSLDTREEPHPHLWKTTLVFGGEPVKGRIADFPALEAAVAAELASLEGCYLNESAILLPEARAFPTCESLGASILTVLREKTLVRFRADNPTIDALSVQVTLCEGDRVYGAAIVEPRL